MNLDPNRVATALQACEEMERHTRSMLAEFPDMPLAAREEMLRHLEKIERDRAALRNGLQ
ncbi:hypothetical protein EJP67_18555 [Variovorax guangxiensis]|uniref:Uncharacterized protein n=1 Tax=Variovorax guangxiensis TaxID=1775474 RepID=A0A433MMC3_9BURK|nr:hypothetical protein [Variovorax guangxiensis]RUR69063.1 hypothetical protein EJP67_18555 [Variovorax guangxiensis]